MHPCHRRGDGNRPFKIYEELRDHLIHGLTRSISEETQEMLFAFKYRSHFKLSEEQYERESDDAKWMAQTVWELEAERDNLKSRSGKDMYN